MQLPLWHICWVSWEREGRRASRRKGQLVPGPRGSGTGSVLAMTEAEQGGCGDWGRSRRLRMSRYLFYSFIEIAGIYCLVWDTGRSHSSRRACHNHCCAFSCLFSVLPFPPWVTSSHTDPLALLPLCHKHVAACICAVIWWLGHLPLGASTTV